MILILFLLIFNISYIISGEDQIGFAQKIFDNSTVLVSLEKYNVSNPDGESFDSFHSLQPNSSFKIILTDIPSDIHFTVVQVHSYLLNVSLSYDVIPLSSNSITGTNIGLIKVNEGQDLNFYLMNDNSLDFVDVMIAVQAYNENVPIPGGCNMEFPIEIYPVMQTTYNDAITEVDFAPSSPPLSRFKHPLPQTVDECNINIPNVTYQMYHRYFPERDFSKETYFKILKSMLTKGRVLKNGAFVRKKPTEPTTRRLFASYPGTGHAFVVLTSFEYGTAVYVPSFTYGCNDLPENNSCLMLPTTFSKILCGSALVLGLFVTLIGHKCVSMAIFVSGLFGIGTVTYILVLIAFPNTNVLWPSAAGGIIGTAVMLVLHSSLGLLLCSLSFGFLLASLLFYFITDLFDLLILDSNFWGIFIGIVTFCPILMICLLEKGRIILYAFMGSYAVVASIDYHVGGNMKYIVLNTIRRATVENFNLAIVDPPFQWRDIFLSIFWIILIILRIVVLHLLMKILSAFQMFYKNRFQRSPRAPNEETPLWKNSSRNSIPYCTI